MRSGHRSRRPRLRSAMLRIEPDHGQARALFSSSHDSIRVGVPAPLGFSSAERGGIVGT